jgi:hypothetical protein
VPASEQPTIRTVAARVEAIEQRIQDIVESLGEMQESRVAEAEAIGQQIQEIGRVLEAMELSRGGEMERIWTALRALAGLDGIAGGMADICELLTELRALVPPSTARPLDPGVPEALQTIRAALVVPRPATNFQSVTTDWDGPVSYIGQVVPVPDSPDPGPHQEQVA